MRLILSDSFGALHGLLCTRRSHFLTREKEAFRQWSRIEFHKDQNSFVVGRSTDQQVIRGVVLTHLGLFPPASPKTLRDK
jgi:hypothetical protein